MTPVFSPHTKVKFSTSQTPSNEKAKVKLTPRSKIGRFLRSPKAWSLQSQPLTDQEYVSLIAALVNALCDAGYLVKEKSEVQLRIDSLLWKTKLLSEIPPDPLTSRRLQGNEDATIPVNSFFQEFYQTNAFQI